MNRSDENYSGRDGSLIWNPDGVATYFLNGPPTSDGRRQVTCGYCRKQTRGSKKRVLYWFAKHTCAESDIGGPRAQGEPDWATVLSDLRDRREEHGTPFTIEDVARRLTTRDRTVTTAQLRGWAPYVDWEKHANPAEEGLAIVVPLSIQRSAFPSIEPEIASARENGYDPDKSLRAFLEHLTGKRGGALEKLIADGVAEGARVEREEADDDLEDVA